MAKRLSENDIFELLTRRGLVPREILQEAREKAKEAKVTLRDALTGMGYPWQKEHLMAIALEMQVEFLDLENFTPTTELGKLIPENAARRYKAIPIDKKDDFLIVAMADPSNSSAIDDISATCRMELRVYLADEDLITEFTNQKYGTPKEVKKRREVDVNFVSPNRLREMSEEPNVARAADHIFTQAFIDGASSITIEPQEDFYLVNYVINDEAKEAMKPPRVLYPALNARIKLAAGVDYTNFRYCQQGKFELTARNARFELQVNTAPSPHGERIEIKIIKRDLANAVHETQQKVQEKVQETQQKVQQDVKMKVQEKTQEVKKGIFSFLKKLIPVPEETPETKAPVELDKWDQIKKKPDKDSDDFRSQKQKVYDIDQ